MNPSANDRARVSELVDRFGYPKPLADLLEWLQGQAREVLGEGTTILLSPSTSTGDFLWRENGGRTELLSDIDGFVFTPAPPRDRECFQRTLGAYEIPEGRGHCEIDLAVGSMDALDRIPRTYQMAETRAAGFVLLGPDVRPRFPDTFDPRASRQSFLLNLWKPTKAFDGNDGDYAQAAARLLCDIGLLAASEAGRCVVGHRERLRWFLERRPSPLGQDPVLCAAVEAALAARLAPPGSRGDLEGLVLPATERLIALLDGIAPGAAVAQGGLALAARFTRWLPPRTLRRVGGELKTLLRRPVHPVADTRWWFERKEAVLGAALVALLRATAPGSDPAPHSREAAFLLSRFGRTTEPSGQGRDFIHHANETIRVGLAELYPHHRAKTAG